VGTSFNPSKGETKQRLLTEGAQPARIARIVDLGTRIPFSEEQRPRKHVLISFELASDKVEVDGEEKPAWISMFMPIASGEKSNLFKFMTALGLPTDQDVDPEKLLGKAILLTIQNKEKKSKDGRKETFSKIVSYSGLPKGFESTLSPLVGDSYFFDFDFPDAAIVAKLSDGVKRMIKESLDYPGSSIQKLLDAAEKEEVI
jgi:hypothetical protein